jgi:hypothetical protein
MFLSSRNTLQSGGSSRRSNSGPPQQGGSSNGGAASRVGSSSQHGSPVPAVAAADAGAVSRDRAQTKSSPVMQLRPASGMLRMSRSSNMLVSPPAADAAAVAGAACPGAAYASNLCSSSSAAEQRQAEQSLQQDSQQHLKSRMLWARALTKSKAVVRLLQAGQQHHSSGSGTAQAASSNSGRQLQQPAGVLGRFMRLMGSSTARATTSSAAAVTYSR